ncbi:MAG TPA: hypoxanthine phosphoribosyltransferase [Flavobacteriales bacterium]|nr:hypoxanthine phosphoribosyltransferase [Flavobacteriales bacterium]
MITVHDKQFRPHIKEDLIQKEVERIGRELMVSHSENAPFFLGVLNGSFMFFSDLMKQFSAPCEIGFLKAASYEGMESTGKVKFHESGKLSLQNRDVIIVEDIVDTGNTLSALIEFLERYQPKSIKICTLLFKKEAYQHSYPIDYVCFEVENKFLLGYGLDYDGYGRNIPEVYILNE